MSCSSLVRCGGDGRLLSLTEQFLADFHNANAGLTARAFGSLPVERNGQLFGSSYACLAHVVGAGTHPVTVLDLACGDGLLLALLAGRQQMGLSLIGIDLSEAELRAAAARLGPGVALHQAMAQRLPLPDASVDCVLCHLALMLMDDVEEAIAEVRRVLKNGAVFSAVVGTRPPPSAAFDTYVALLAEFPRRAEFQALRFGDVRVRTPEGLAELLASSFKDVRFEHLLIQRRCTPPALWSWLCDMYDLHLLSPQDRSDMQRRYIAALTPLCGPDGKLDHLERLLQVSATAA